MKRQSSEDWVPEFRRNLRRDISILSQIQRVERAMVKSRAHLENLGSHEYVGRLEACLVNVIQMRKNAAFFVSQALRKLNRLEKKRRSSK